MAVYGHYKEPQKYDQDQQISKYGETKPRKDYQKNKYQKKDKERISYIQTVKKKISYYGREDQKEIWLELCAEEVSVEVYGESRPEEEL